MKRSSHGGFTLVELLTVIVIITVLTSLVIGVSSLSHYNAAKHRTTGEIAAMSAALENYRADNGTYPRLAGVTEPTAVAGTDFLDPRKDASPTGSGTGARKYQLASQFLYEELSGDKVDRDFKANPGEKAYYEFKPDFLNAQKKDGKVILVNWIQDAWGNCYGYSTGYAFQEQAYTDTLRARPDADRTEVVGPPAGYNPTFDLWSTGGSNRADPSEGSAPGPFKDSPKWIKNW
jgi:prepilin-type N-terminal cleavage/methylation domain-containing protein